MRSLAIVPTERYSISNLTASLGKQRELLHNCHSSYSLVSLIPQQRSSIIVAAYTRSSEELKCVFSVMMSHKCWVRDFPACHMLSLWPDEFRSSAVKLEVFGVKRTVEVPLRKARVQHWRSRKSATQIVILCSLLPSHVKVMSQLKDAIKSRGRILNIPPTHSPSLPLKWIPLISLSLLEPPEENGSRSGQQSRRRRLICSYLW